MFTRSFHHHKNTGLLRFFLWGMILANYTSVGQTKTVTYKPGPTIGQDALLNNTFGCRPIGYPKPGEKLNYGAHTEVAILDWTISAVGCSEATNRSVLKFSGLDSFVAKRYKVLNAQLKLYCVNSSGNWGTSNFPGSPYPYSNPGWVERVSGHWAEDTVTWDTQPGTVTLHRAAIPASGARWGWSTSVNVTNLINDIILSGYNEGFMLKLQTESYYRSILFASSDHTDSTLWPELTITYDTICGKVRADFGSNPIGCLNQAFTDSTKSAGGSVVSRKWYFGDGDSSVSVAPIHLYPADGAYTVKLIITTDAGCSDTVEKQINVPAVSHFATYTYAFKSCFGAQFYDGSGLVIKKWNWDFGDGTSSSISNPMHLFPGYGKYPVTLVVESDGGCKDTISKMVEIAYNHFANAGKDTSVCILDGLAKITLAGNPGMASYSWLPAKLLDDPTSATPTATFLTPTTFELRVTDTFGCVDSDYVTINLYPEVKLFVRPDDVSFCKGTFIQLSATGADTYKWSPATELSNPFIANPSLYLQQDETYLLEGTDANGCKGYKKVVLSVLPAGQIQISPSDTAVCAGDSVLLTVSGGSQYAWWTTKQEGDTVRKPNWLVPANGTPTYYVKGYNSWGCADQDSVTITTLPLPEVKVYADRDTITCRENKAILYAEGNYIADYEWYPANLCSNSSGSSTTVYPFSTTLFSVKATGVNGCVTTSFIRIFNEGKSGISIPNAFTPNNDGLNDVFRATDQCNFIPSSLAIYNRWGTNVFFCEGTKCFWDGKINGQEAEVGVYFYMFKGKSGDGSDVMFDGDVTLIR